MIEFCDWQGRSFLCTTASGSRWVFLEELSTPPIGIPAPVCIFITETLDLSAQFRKDAQPMREDGLLDQYLTMLEELKALDGYRDEMIMPYLRSKQALRGPILAEVHSSSSHIAAQLSLQHYGCLDGFWTGQDLHACLKQMHGSGELVSGSIASGYNQESRGDFMRWIPARGPSVPSEISRVLDAVSDLVLGLMRSPQTRGELTGRQLQRSEVQATCYPGASRGRYVRHVDETGGMASVRVLTCIVYANPLWKSGDGGELRLHLPGGNVDIEPIDGRLVIFWSDHRVPHEVLPSMRDRLALSIWFHDMTARGPSAERSESDPIDTVCTWQT